MNFVRDPKYSMDIPKIDFFLNKVQIKVSKHVILKCLKSMKFGKCFFPKLFHMCSIHVYLHSYSLILCTLIDCPIHINTVIIGLSNIYV